MAEAVVTEREQPVFSVAYRHVWRALNALSATVGLETAYLLALQVIYLRCRSSSGWARLVRRSEPAGLALARAWAGTDVARTYGLAAPHTIGARRIPDEAVSPLATLIGEIDRLAVTVGLFDACLDRYSSPQAKGGDYFTPSSLARLIAGLAAPQAGETVRDPVCGSGRLLLAAAQWAQEHGGGAVQLYGNDIRREARYVAALNLSMNCLIPDLGTDAADSLRAGPANVSADVILANPPMNMKDWGREELSADSRWTFGLPPKGNANFAWVQHILADLAPQGRAVVHLPDSAARNTNMDDGHIRRALVESGLVAAVVALPTRLFPHTRTGTSLWLLAKGHRPRADETLFIDARRLGTSKDATGRRLKDEHVDQLCRILAVWQGIRQAEGNEVPELPSWCHPVGRRQIEVCDYNLSPSTYMPKVSLGDAPHEEETRQSKAVLYECFDHTAAVKSQLLNALGEKVPDEYRSQHVARDLHRSTAEDMELSRRPGDHRTPWSTCELGAVPGVQSVAYGVVRPRQDPTGIPMIGAADITNGTVNTSNLTRIHPELARQHPRTSLLAGDLLVVLVGRVGDTAVATEEHEGCNVGRSVAVIRCTTQGSAAGTNRWIRWWLKTSQAREYLRAHSANAGHATLPLAALGRTPVALPPLDLRSRHLRTITLAEQRMALNTQIAVRATDLADEHFTCYAQDHATARWTDRTVEEVGRVITGSECRERADGLVETSWAAPKEVLNSNTVHLGRTAGRTWVSPEDVCPPGTLLVAPRPGEVRTVLATMPVTPGRRSLAIRVRSEADQMWLLHALRSKSLELVSTAQGQQARAMRRKDFSRFAIPWPSETTRQDFSRIAMPLHGLSLAATGEIHALEELVVRAISDTTHTE